MSKSSSIRKPILSHRPLRRDGREWKGRAAQHTPHPPPGHNSGGGEGGRWWAVGGGGSGVAGALTSHLPQISHNPPLVYSGAHPFSFLHGGLILTPFPISLPHLPFLLLPLHLLFSPFFLFHLLFLLFSSYPYFLLPPFISL